MSANSRETQAVCPSITGTRVQVDETIGYSAFYKNSSSNPNLTSIINTTGINFDWSNIITGSSGTSSITGTYNGVNVTTE